MRTNPHLALVAALALGQGAVGYASAQSAPKEVAAPSPAPVAASGLTVAIDPVTKQIRPVTAEDAAALEAAKKAQPARTISSQKLVPLQYPGGRKSLRLPESYLESAIATKSSDGKISFRCVSNRDLEANGLPPAAAVKPSTTQPAVPTQTVRLEEK